MGRWLGQACHPEGDEEEKLAEPQVAEGLEGPTCVRESPQHKHILLAHILLSTSRFWKQVCSMSKLRVATWGGAAGQRVLAWSLLSQTSWILGSCLSRVQ